MDTLKKIFNDELKQNCLIDILPKEVIDQENNFVEG